MKNHILIYGWYGYGNLGDEAILIHVVGRLKSRWPNLDITVCTSDEAGTRSQLNVATRPRTLKKDFLSFLRLLRRSRLLVVAGGTLLEDQGGSSGILTLFVVFRLAKLFGTQVLLYGQGAGPIRGWLSRRLARAALSAVEAATVRDSGSLAEMIRLGFPRGKVLLAADEAISLPPLAVRTEATRPAVVFCPKAHTPWSQGHTQDELAQHLAQAADAIQQKLDCDIILLPFQTGGFHADDVMCRDIARRMQGKAILPPTPVSVDAARTILANAQACVAMRLHAAIFSAGLGIPVVGLPYADKVRFFFSEISRTHLLAHTPQEIPGLLEEALRRHRPLPDDDTFKVFRDRARLNFDTLAACLDGPRAGGHPPPHPQALEPVP